VLERQLAVNLFECQQVISVARTKRLAMSANPPHTTKRARLATIAVAATSSSGSGGAICALDGSPQARGLSRKVLSAPQKLTEWCVGWRSQ
jgi:hypothetical protein